MTEGDVGALLRQAMLVALRIGGPPLAAVLAVGLLVAVFQAMTQVNEATLSFVPKVLAVSLTLALTGPAMFAALSGLSRMLFDQLITIGGAG